MPADDRENPGASEGSADLLEQEVLGDDARDADGTSDGGDGEGDVEDSAATFSVDLDPEDQGTAEAAAANPD